MFSKKVTQYPILMDTTKVRSSGSASVAITGIPPSITSAVSGTQPLFIPYTQGGGGGSTVSTFTNLYTSTLNTSTLQANTGFFDTINVSSLNVSSFLLSGLTLSTLNVSSLVGNAGAFNTFNLSSLVANSGSFSTINVSSLVADIGAFSTLGVSSLSGNLGLFNTISSLSSIAIDATASNMNVLGGLNLNSNVLTTAGTNPVELLLNGIPIATTSPVTDVADWAVFPASQDVNMNGKNLVDSQLNLLGNASAGSLNGRVTLTAENGIGGVVGITANSGLGGVSGGNVTITANGGTAPSGLYGQVNIIANQGVADPGTGSITTGGYINIQANSGSITTPTATSRIDLNAGGLNLYSGIVSPITSVFGYTFLNALNGVSIVSGTWSSAFQVPGTVYLYGTQGIVLNSPVYTSDIYPYWNGLAPPANLTIHGRTTIAGSASVVLNNVASMSMEGAGTISGVTSINGSSYPPSFTLPADINVSTVTLGTAGSIDFSASDGVITGLSSINGSIYPPSFTLPADVNFSTITLDTAGSIDFSASDGVITGLSTINGSIYPPSFTLPADINVSTITLGTAGSIDFSASDGVITGLSTINGVAYPGGITGVNFYTGEISVVGGGGITVTNTPAQTVTIQNTGGRQALVTGSDQSISIPGLTSTGTVMLTIVGTNHHITDITNSTDTCDFTVSGSASTSDSVVWMVVSYV